MGIQKARRAGQQSGGKTLSEVQELQAELYAAAVYGNDDDRLDAATQVLKWKPCQKVVRAWLSRLPRAIAVDTAMLLGSVISSNALNLAEVENLEAAMRQVYFITALRSPFDSVMGALSGKNCTKLPPS